MCVLLPSGCWDRIQHRRNLKPSHTAEAERKPIPVFEEAAKTKGDEFEDGFQHEGGGEEIVAVLQDKIQGLEREHTVCVCEGEMVELQPVYRHTYPHISIFVWTQL